MKRKRHRDGDKIMQVSLPRAPSLPYSSRRPVRPPRGRLRSALSQLTCALACAHAHETLIWASKSKGARHTFNYDLISLTQKPLRFVRRALFVSMKKGNLALDPYTNSGTTAVAKKPNRAFIGVELEEELAKSAARRMAATQRGSLLREISEQPWSNA